MKIVRRTEGNDRCRECILVEQACKSGECLKAYRDRSRDDSSPMRLSVLVALLLTFASAAGVLRGQVLHTLTTVREVRALDASEAAKARPVHLRGVVTAISGWKSTFFVQDETAGIFVDRTNSSPQLHSGQAVEINGVTGPGSFAPVVIPEKVTVTGEGRLPASPFFRLQELAGGNQDSQFIAMRGIVRSAVVETIWAHLVLALAIDVGEGKIVTAQVHDFSGADLNRLPDSTVLVRGVCGTVFNDKRQFLGARMHISSMADVTIERWGAGDPFKLQARSLSSLQRFGDPTSAIIRVKVRGIVTSSRPGHGLYLQDGSEGILVQSRQTTAVSLGSRLEVVGYPAAGRYSPQLDDAVFRVVGAGAPVAALPEAGSAMIVDNLGWPAAPFDSVLVQLKGLLIEEVPGADEDLLLLRDGSTLYTARLPHSSQTHRVLTPGSLLSITGICMANADETHVARSFEIGLRSPDDVVVLRRASWWTGSHATWIAVLLGTVVLAMAGWMAVARRHSSLRTMAVTDPLTGLYNRRGFLLLTEHQWLLACRRKRWFLLFYIDVDKFKEINDTLGHKEGDLVLQAVAGLLRESFRKTDIIGRIGGDEFAVVAVDSPPHTQGMLERRLDKALKDHNERASGTPPLCLSVGVLTCAESLRALSIDDLMAKADGLMYRQKQNRMTRDVTVDVELQRT